MGARDDHAADETWTWYPRLEDSLDDPDPDKAMTEVLTDHPSGSWLLWIPDLPIPIFKSRLSMLLP